MKQILLNLIILFVVFLLTGIGIKAQVKDIPQALKIKLQGKTKLSDIMIEVDYYYTNQGKKDNGKEVEEGESSYQHWKRWERWMSSHLDVNGDFININKANGKALDLLNAKWETTLHEQANRLHQQPLGENAATNFKGNSPSNIEGLTYGQWWNVGPTINASGSGDLKGVGRFDRIAFHPTDANIFYVGAPTGQLWKTTNGGVSWASITDALSNPGIAGIAISPTNGNVIYILTGDGDSHNPGNFVYDYGASPASSGGFKSIDGGQTWVKMGNLYTGADEYTCHKLTISEFNENYLFATTNKGIYRTMDGGISWTQVKAGKAWDVKFKPGSDSIIYATTDSAIFYSTKGGRINTWDSATTNYSVAKSLRIELAVSANSPDYVYALCGNAATGSFTGIFRSGNSGVDYTRRCVTPNILGSTESGGDGDDQSNYDLCIALKPTNAEFVVTGGITVWVSNGNNGATNMVWCTKYREGSAGAANKYIHPDVHAVAYNPLNNNLYALSDGGVYRSTDDGTSWTDMSAGIANSQLYDMTMKDSDGDGEAEGFAILTGAQDNGIKYRSDAGGIFSHIFCCDGASTAINGLHPDTMYMIINTSLYKTTNGGGAVINRFQTDWFSPIAVDYTAPDTIYVGGANIKRTFNGFIGRTNLNVNASRVLVTTPSSKSRLYASSGSDIIASNNIGESWVNIKWSGGPTLTVNDIKTYPTNANEVYVCFGGYSDSNKVKRTTNSGGVWQDWTGSLPNVPTYSLAVGTEGVYLGTELGVFFRSYSMTDWVPFYNGMPRIPVTKLVLNKNGTIYASTFGRGIWYSERRSSTCNNLLYVAGLHNGAWYYEANVGANTVLTSTGSSGTEIFMQAGDSVVLKPGFEVKSGAFFKGYIAPCNNGGVPSTSAKGSNNGFLVPHLKEYLPAKKQPLKNANYFQVVKETIEFNLTQKGILKMMVKNEDGSWALFYPEDSFYPGLYSLPAPKTKIMEFKFLLDGGAIEQLH
jgi:photosystem II stability/assembly factor-like uncharacterized protein